MCAAGLARCVLRALAIGVGVHGMIFAIASITLVHADGQVLQAIGDAYFFVVIAPALILALPFTALLWHLHLMEAPGWFAWPKPLGFALVYGVWIAVLLAASFVRIRR